MKEFTQDGMFNELSKITRAINRKKYESMDLPRYNLGGGSCPDGLTWDETLQQCVDITNLKEVSITPVSRHLATYEETNPFQDFFAKKKADYIRKAGNFGKLTDLESNFPEAQIKKIRDEYEYLKNNYVAKKLGHNYNDREKWIDKLTPSEREVLQNSEFASKLRPSLWAKTKAGLIGLGNTLLPGQPLEYDVKGLSPKEEAEYKKNKLAALDAVSFADLPGAVISNALSNSREYASNPGIFSGEIVNDAGELGAGLLNPLLPIEIGTGVSLAPDLIELGLKGAQGAFKAGRKLSKVLPVDNAPLDNLGNVSTIPSENYKGFIDYENINGLDELQRSLHGTGYTVKPTWGYYTPEELASRHFNHKYSIKQDSWPFETPKELRSRDVQKEFFDQGDEFANKWYKKNPEAYDDAVQRLSNENKKSLNDILNQDEMQVYNEVDSMKQGIRNDFFAKNNISSSDYWTAKINNGDLAKFVDDQVNGRYHELIKNNNFDVARNAKYEKLLTKLNENELAKDKIRQEIVDNLDPYFKRKVEALYEFSEKPHPSLKDWTKSIVPTKKHLLHYGDESNVNELSPSAKSYLKDNVNNIGGVKLNTGETLTVASTPSVTEKPTFFIEPDRGRPVFTGNKRVRVNPVKLSDPTTWGNIFEKKVLKPQYKRPRIEDHERILVEIENQMMNDPQYISEVAAHEEGHNQQLVANWDRLIQEHNPTYEYLTNHDRNELAKAYKDAMVEPQLPGTSSHQVGKYDYETWKSGVGELHSELNKSRLNAAQYYMQQGMSMDEAIQTLKQLEADGDDELFQYYIDASGKLDKHFKPNVNFKTKKTLLQALPVVGATMLTGKKLFENEESPLPNNQRYGGNISNLQKFLR